VQVNGAYGYDFTNDATSVTEVARKLPEAGVTGFVPTIITSKFEAYSSRLREVRDGMRANVPGARILGAHLEGPYLSPARKGAHPPAYLRKIDVAEIRAWAEPDVVRIVTLAPELEGALEAVRLLRQAGLVVSAGHSNATFNEAMAGFQAGISWGTHLYNAMSPFQHREPGLAGALLVSDIPCGLIVDGIHSHPATVRVAWKNKGADQITLVTDCMQAMGMPPGRYILGDHAVVVDDTAARLEDGTLAGSILKMDEAIRNMMAFSGCSLADAVRMASITPARLLGLERRGTIAPGCDADLVVLSPENKVTHTLVGGTIVYESSK
jgi:N-acetylglucosamine-6-phosphate deacetylase